MKSDIKVTRRSSSAHIAFSRFFFFQIFSATLRTVVLWCKTIWGGQKAKLLGAQFLEEILLMWKTRFIHVALISGVCVCHADVESWITCFIPNMLKRSRSLLYVVVALHLSLSEHLRVSI